MIDQIIPLTAAQRLGLSQRRSGRRAEQIEVEENTVQGNRDAGLGQTKSKTKLDSIEGVRPRMIQSMVWLSKVQGREREPSRKGREGNRPTCTCTSSAKCCADT